MDCVQPSFVDISRLKTNDLAKVAETLIITSPAAPPRVVSDAAGRYRFGRSRGTPVESLMIPIWYHQGMALTLRTDEQMETALNELTSELGLSRQEIIRLAILELHERSLHASLVENATSKMMSRWADVLQRLGTE